MIYHLFELLKDCDIPGQRLFTYLSFRAIFASATAILISLIFGKKIIRWLQKKQIGEEIRDLGLEGQMQKKGTPTMGGVIIIVAILISVLLFADLTNIYIILLLVTTVWLGLLGFADDSIKVFRHNKEGLSEKAKLAAQVILGLSIGITVCFSNDIVVRERIPLSTDTGTVSAADSTIVDKDSELRVNSGQWAEQDVVKSTKTTIPFVKNHEFDYKWLSPFKGAAGWYCKWAIYVVMIVLVITACSNGTNLTDGMDGLSTGTSAIVGVVLGIFAYLSGNILNAEYLNIMYIPGTGEIAVFMAAFVGALIGFLWYNSYPAQVFMGDTGSLAIGGIIGVCAILIRKELLLPVLCGIFLVESLSVLMQRFYFKYTKRRYGTGKRIFRMAPLHHHFQKENVPALINIPKRAVPEAKIVVRFWIIGILLAVFTIALLKIR
ncbi:MAG: phospho-N-acetylmuramoyl-pentapeptide-transferase [Bacteroidetes bacterium]|uniref:Phospho-N-acetylmuramoyl-pentapeptide-transferase n=1 Tax=Candidatus Cryptobacteroides excrementavium TaxID=2840759 RepID=A0A9D9NSG6_9BACT|nr:phospho-N-acetylmuramoyl-pentapeptide-transferase [Candidatus Cryptobacteroides excrementavium]